MRGGGGGGGGGGGREEEVPFETLAKLDFGPL